MESDSISIKTQNSIPPRKQVGFTRTRPTLIIPPPQDYRQQYTGTSGPTPNHLHPRKQSVFNFEQLQDFTKTGLGAGEKCAYWLYNKLRSWSRKWFTHIFLSVVLIVYTIGGALIFELIEGQTEAAVELEIRSARDKLMKYLRESSLTGPRETTLDEWMGEASRKLQDYEHEIVQRYHTTHKLVVANRSGKIWTLWNAIVFCSTVYTTIEIDMARIEAMVTPEQVHSASVAKKRRTYTKKRSAHRRDQTPLKEIDDKTTTTDEDAPEQRPKTPERRRRKKTVSKQTDSKSEPENTEIEKPQTTVKKSRSFTKTTNDDYKKRESITELAQAEVVALFNKTKKGIAAAANRGREKLKKFDKEQVKRSQSAPHAFTQEELIESFRKAQLLDDSSPKPIRKESSSSVISEQIPAPKPFRPEVQEFVRQRRKQRAISTKIVEILDPKTSNVIATKTIVKPDFRLRQLFSVIRVFTIKELLASFRMFKMDMKDECQRIRILRNRCMCELFIIMIYCGLGGFLFKFIEGSFEYFYKCGVKRVKRDFIELLWIKSHNLREEDWKSLARNKLRTFEEELHVAHEAGMKTYSGQRSWSFLNAVVYCLSIVTTIGYGHIYPETKTGKALTIVYAIIGIPLFLLALTDFGKLFTRCIKFLWSFVRRLYYTGSCRKVRKTTHAKEIIKGAQMMYEIATFRRPSIFSDAENPETPSTQIGDDTPTTPAMSNFEIDDEFNLPVSLAIFILLLYIFLGGLIYCVWERWAFFDSFYFVFISMSTVGFGDMVPDDAICMIVSIVYLVFGLALMSMCINVVQDKLGDTFKQASSKIGVTIGIAVSDDDGSIATVPPDTVEIPQSDSNSIKSVGTPSSLKTSNSVSPTSRKQVGFARIRPTLIIPPPQDYKVPQQYTATAGISGPTPVYIAKESVFSFQHQLHGIKDFTKSGLGAGEKCAYWLYNKLKTWSRKWFTHMFLTLVLVIYTIGGALLFEYIEAPEEPPVQLIDIRIPRYNLITDLRNLSLMMPNQDSDEEWENQAIQSLQDYEEVYTSWYTKDKLLKKNLEGKRWTFWNAIVFCGTIYTTIGYGHIVPQTMTGKVLTIVYSIIGIPLFLLALTDFGKLFTRCIKVFWSFVRRVYYTGSCRQVRKTAHMEEIFKGAQKVYEIATFRRPSAFVDPENPEAVQTTSIGDQTPTTPALSNFEIDDEFNLPISLAIFILVVYILLGALIYSLWEDWAFFNAFYFVFISMSTIGFGDMVPDDPACMIVSIVYLVFGLALMSMCINVVQVKLSDTFKQASSKIGATIGITVADDDGSITVVPPENIEMPQVHHSKSLGSLTTPNDINENEQEKIEIS
ncbi:uncharacterized protein BDFB_001752 [Asbolus verrucosus]|uniref:Potassium channel domain-containing protein n=1 Tax=Asbolus verrucosus TaxID=1661398 RepID=A0A482VFI5_ASBVE|nr:uncharacterized protein BDFB_001752 [Asbolus verrucosus]